MTVPPLDLAYQEASKCNRCGFCQTACPVYQVTRKESSTARGHHYQVRSAVEGRLPLSPGLGQPLDECLLCRACVPQCSPRVQTDRVVAAARHALTRQDRQTQAITLLLRKLLLHPKRLRRSARLAAAASSLGLTRIAAIGGLGISRAGGLIRDVPAPALRDRIRGMRLEPASPKGRVAYFAGCGVNYLLPDAGEDTIRMVVASGFSVALANSYCCGLPSYANGDPNTARRLARGNIRLLKSQAVDAIVTDCASCSSFLKSYAQLLEDDPVFGPLAADFAGKVLDITELFNRSVGHIGLNEVPMTVTYHDPCHASRYQGLREEPRRILQSIPGLTLVEMEEADWCCGGAGTFGVKHPELSDRILDRKMENVARTRAGALVTSCPSCILQLSYGVRRHSIPTKVVHLSQVLAMAAKGQPGSWATMSFT